jgi:hypothetical protein
MSQAMAVACSSVVGQGAIGRPEDTVLDWVNGKHPSPDLEPVVKIERITGCRATSCGLT